MIPCEVVNAAGTGKPCPNPGTESAELVYPSGVSETKRCCPEHAEMVRKASESARSAIAARVAARREESDARRERVLAARRLSRPPEEPAPPVTQAPEVPTMSEPAAEVSEPVSRGTPAPKPVRDPMAGVKKCRWCGIGKFPLCGTDRDRLRVLRKWSEEPACVPADFDPATSPIEPIREAWDRRAAWIRDTAAKARAAKQQDGEDEDKGRAEMLHAAAVENRETNEPYVRPPTGLADIESRMNHGGVWSQRELQMKADIAWLLGQMRGTKAHVRRSDVEEAISGKRTTGSDDPLISKLMDIAADRHPSPGAGETKADTPPVSGAYADGHAVGDRDRMFRCRQDVARALGGEGVNPIGWEPLMLGVRRAVHDRDEAVRAIAPLRADAAELRDLLDALRTGTTDAPIRPETQAAVDAAAERLLSTVREKAGKHDDRVVVVMKFATERILDALARLTADGRPADLGLLDALRAIAIGQVPQASNV